MLIVFRYSFSGVDGAGCFLGVDSIGSFSGAIIDSSFSRVRIDVLIDTHLFLGVIAFVVACSLLRVIVTDNCFFQELFIILQIQILLEALFFAVYISFLLSY